VSATDLRIALLQLAGCGYDRDAGLARGEAACRAAAAAGADLALFPELWSTGYGFVNGSLRRWRAQAIARDDPWVRAHSVLAGELGMAIAVTYLERWPAGPRNVVTLFDRAGREVLTYAKVHTCTFDLPEQALTPGVVFPVASLETRAGPVAVGAMICFDREFPEAARLLALGGAELILVPNACELEANRLGQVRARAFENAAAVAVANYAAPQENGHSTLIDPIAFDAEGRSRDTRVFEAGEAEEVCLVRLDLDAVRAWRRREVWGKQCRRPRTYGALTAAGGGLTAGRAEAGGLAAGPADTDGLAAGSAGAASSAGPDG
jgi:N-carbamoylputrescine amidase